jgi:TolA-binding protein
MKNNYVEQINLYLTGALQGEELQAFTAELAHNTELQDLVALQKQIDGNMSAWVSNTPNQEALSQTLASNRHFFTEQNIAQQGKVVRLNKKSIPVRWLALAATAAAVALIFILVPFGGKYNTTEAMANLITQETLSVERGADSINLAKQAMNDKDYNKAITIINALNQPQNTELNLLKAIARYQTKSYNEAAWVLVPIANGTSLLKDEACAWLAKSLFAQNKKDEAKTYLLKISQSSKMYTQAQKIASKL